MAIAPLWQPNAGQPAPLWQPVVENVVTAEQQQAAAQAAAPVPGAAVNKITVISPKDGKAYDIAETDLAGAQAQGYKLETAEGKAIREYVQENQGLSGTAKVALHGFLDQATFGVYGAADDAGKDPLEKAKADALRQDHAIANIVGQGAGFGASMFYGGEFFKAAQGAGRVAEAAVLGERVFGAQVAAKLVQAGVPAAEAAATGAGLARRLIASGAKLGAEGAVFAAPKAITEAALGDPERAAETMMYGLGGGAVLGLAGGVAGSVGKAMAGSLSHIKLPGSGGPGLAAKVREWGDEQAVSAMGLAKKFSTKLNDRKMMQDVPRIFREGGLGELAGDAEAAAAKIAEMREQTGEKIGALYAEANAAGPSSLTEASELRKALRGIGADLDLPENALKNVGRVQATKQVNGWVEDEVINMVDHLLSDPKRAAAGMSDKLSLTELHDLRMGIDRATKWDKQATDVVNELKIDLRGRVKDILDKRIEAAGNALGKDIKGQLAPLNRDYGVLSILGDNAENNIGRAAANQSPSLTDKLGGAAGSIVGGMIGGVPGAIVGAGVGTLVNNQLRRKAPAMLSEGAHGVADWLERRGMAGVLEANASAATQLARVPDILGAMSAGKRAAVDTLPIHALTSYAEQLSVGQRKGDTTTPQAPGQGAFATLAAKLTDLTANPDKMGAAVKKMVEPFEAGAPNVAAQLALKAPAALQHLADTMPKAPVVSGLLAPKLQWTPSQAQQAEWARRWGVVQNPFAVFDRLADKSLTSAEVDTLRAVYPKLHEAMVARVVDYASQPQAKPLSFRDRDRLSLLMGVPLDGTDYGAVQSLYAAKPPQPKTGPAMKAPDVATNAQRLTYK